VEASGDDRLKNHPMTLQKDWKDKTVPLFLHGDGVSFQQRDTLLAYSWGSLLSFFSSLDSHFLISLFPKSCTMESTWDPLMKWLVWSFNALQKGKHPDKDPDGNSFPAASMFEELKGEVLTPGNFRAVIWSIQGDHEFFANVLKLPHWSTASPCWECDAKRDNGNLQKWVKTIRPSQQNFVLVDTQTATLKKASEHPSHLYNSGSYKSNCQGGCIAYFVYKRCVLTFDWFCSSLHVLERRHRKAVGSSLQKVGCHFFCHPAILSEEQHTNQID
jgi:hypothetical protein